MSLTSFFPPKSKQHDHPIHEEECLAVHRSGMGGGTAPQRHLAGKMFSLTPN